MSVVSTSSVVPITPEYRLPPTTANNENYDSPGRRHSAMVNGGITKFSSTQKSIRKSASFSIDSLLTSLDPTKERKQSAFKPFQLVEQQPPQTNVISSAIAPPTAQVPVAPIQPISVNCFRQIDQSPPNHNVMAGSNGAKFENADQLAHSQLLRDWLALLAMQQQQQLQQQMIPQPQPQLQQYSDMSFLQQQQADYERQSMMVSPPCTSNYKLSPTGSGTHSTPVMGMMNESHEFEAGGRKQRTVYDMAQVNQLEHWFQTRGIYIVGADREALAQQLNLSETQVRIWFQNRRSKYRKERRLPTSCSPSELSSDMTS